MFAYTYIYIYTKEMDVICFSKKTPIFKLRGCVLEEKKKKDQKDPNHQIC